MIYDVIYYFASHTAACERAVLSSLAGLNMIMGAANAAASVTAFGNIISDALSKANLVLVITDLSDDSKTGALKILPKAIGSDRKVTTRKIAIGDSCGVTAGYALSCDGQMILVLDDNGEHISEALTVGAREYIADYFKLS